MITAGVTGQGYWTLRGDLHLGQSDFPFRLGGIERWRQAKMSNQASEKAKKEIRRLHLRLSVTTSREGSASCSWRLISGRLFLRSLDPLYCISKKRKTLQFLSSYEPATASPI